MILLDFSQTAHIGGYYSTFYSKILPKMLNLGFSLKKTLSIVPNLFTVH